MTHSFPTRALPIWLAHGVTTVREMGALNGTAWTLQQKALAQENKIAAPNLVVHSYFPAMSDRIKTISTPAQAREWVTALRSEEHTSELQSLMRISSAVFCLKQKKDHTNEHT